MFLLGLLQRIFSVLACSFILSFAGHWILQPILSFVSFSCCLDRDSRDFLFIYCSDGVRRDFYSSIVTTESVTSFYSSIVATESVATFYSSIVATESVATFNSSIVATGAVATLYSSFVYSYLAVAWSSELFVLRCGLEFRALCIELWLGVPSSLL